MNNNFEFLRKFFSSDSNEIIIQVFKSLRNEGLDVYIRKDESDYFVANVDSDLEGTDTIYLAAADCDFGKEIVDQMGYGQFVLDYKTGYVFKTDAEIAEEMYLKKRKWTYIEALVIIIIGIFYFLLKR